MELDRAKLEAVLSLNSLGCIWCGHQDWASATEPTMMIRAGELQVPGPVASINMFPVKCNNCGMVYWFDGKALAKD